MDFALFVMSKYLNETRRCRKQAKLEAVERFLSFRRAAPSITSNPSKLTSKPMGFGAIYDHHIYCYLLTCHINVCEVSLVY